MNLPSYQRRESVQPVNVGQIFLSSFVTAQQAALQQQRQREVESERRQQMAWESEDREYEQTVLRPMREDAAAIQQQSAKLQLDQSQINLKTARAELDRRAALNDQIKEVLGITAPKQNPTSGPMTGETFGGLPITNQYERAKVSWFGGSGDPEDNGLSAWGGSNNSVPGVAIPEKILKSIYGHAKGSGGKFSDGQVRVKARLSDGTEKEMIVPIVDKGTAEWVVKRDGMKLDLNRSLAEQLGAKVDRNRISGIEDVDFELLDREGNPIAGKSQSPSPANPPSAQPQQTEDPFPTVTRFEKITGVLNLLPNNDPLRIELGMELQNLQRNPEFQNQFTVRQQQQETAQLFSDIRVKLDAAPVGFLQQFQIQHPNLTGFDPSNPAQVKAFATAWDNFSAEVSKKGLPQQQMPSSALEEIRKINEATSSVKPDPKNLEAMEKWEAKQNAGRAAAQTLQDIATWDPATAFYIRQKQTEAARAERAARVQERLKKGGGTGDPPPPPQAAIPTATERRNPHVKDQISQQWTAAKSEIETKLSDIYPTEQDKLHLAADVVRGELMRTEEWKNGNEAIPVKEGVLLKVGIQPSDVLFQEKGNQRTGTQTVKAREAIMAWAEEYLTARGFDKKGKPAQSAQPSQPNPEVQSKAAAFRGQ